jgi:demethylmenaquinone methyltransferase/2-methoxy-6-polyprenyl-1,4-benzoquinol methylase
MAPNPFNWLDARSRRDLVQKHPQQDNIASYGFELMPADAKAQRVRHHFESVARYYDLMNTLLSFGIHYLWKRTAVATLALQPGDHVLDVCGGTGDLAILAARAVGPAGRVAIYDINRPMILAGIPKFTHTALAPRITAIQGDAEHLAITANRFDAVMVGFGIRNVTDMPRGFREMYRILKPGGKMMCLEFSKPRATLFRRLYDLYSFYVMPWLGEILVGNRAAYTHLPETIRMFPLPDELARILTDIGFRDVAYRRLTNGIAVIHVGVK